MSEFLTRAWALLRFAGYFLRQSLEGGLDVSRRALDPRKPLDILELDYSLDLNSDAAQTLFVAVVSLMPGTLSCGIVDSCVRVHSITGDPMDQLEDLERRIRGLMT